MNQVMNDQCKIESDVAGRWVYGH